MFQQNFLIIFAFMHKQMSIFTFRTSRTFSPLFLLTCINKYLENYRVWGSGYCIVTHMVSLFYGVGLRTWHIIFFKCMGFDSVILQFPQLFPISITTFFHFFPCFSSSPLSPSLLCYEQIRFLFFHLLD